MYSKLCRIGLVFVLCGAARANAAEPAGKSPDKPAAALKVVEQPLSIDSGQIRGLVGEADDVHVYRGIPFAAPPVGDLRWRPPQPAQAWTGVRECYAFGSAAPQKLSPMLATFPGMALGAAMNEDCLYLNVWTPARRTGEPLPVLVWIHGGGYTMGAGSQRLYDGEDLARRGAVVVSINYRLGALGFLAHPELSAESPQLASGNYGLLDQIAALEWVQRNAAAFGGDKDRVTILGESAGGGSVFSLLASPLAKGLFHRAIAQSGPTLNFVHLKKSNYGFPTAEEMGVEFAKSCGMAEGPGQIAALRQASAEQLLKATPAMEEQREFNMRGNLLKMAPVVDGWVLAEDAMTAFAAGRVGDVPLLVGANRDEGTMFALMAKMPKNVEEYTTGVERNFGAVAPQILAAYPAQDAAQARKAVTDMVGDVIFVAPARFVARSTAGGAPCWLYHFTRPPAGPTGKMMGAHHGAEIAYALDNLELTTGVSAGDEQLRDTMVGYWLQFAATGNPNRDGLPEWPAYDATTDRCQVLDERVETATALRKSRLDAIDAFMDAWRNETGVAAN